MRIIVCGDRKWTDYKFIYAWIEEMTKIHAEVHHLLRDYPRGFEPLIIIEGEARGVDLMSRIAGEALGLEVLRFPANWDKYGRAAGPIRNKQMLKEGKPDAILAFHDDLEHSKGTKDMIEQAKRVGLPFRVITHKDGLPTRTS